MIDTTLTPLLRGGSEATDGTVRLLVRWDRETGWAHVAIAEQGSGARFVGFHRFAGGGAEAVVAELHDRNMCVTAPPQRVEDGLMEIEAVLVRKGGGHG